MAGTGSEPDWVLPSEKSGRIGALDPGSCRVFRIVTFQGKIARAHLIETICKIKMLIVVLTGKNIDIFASKLSILKIKGYLSIRLESGKNSKIWQEPDRN